MRMFLRGGVAAAVVLLVATSPAPAFFHIATISEVMSGVGANPNLQYVEIRMLAAGQSEVASTRLTVFACDSNNTATVLLLVPSNVPNGLANRSWIMASPGSSAFLAASGITPDFTWDNAATGNIPPSCGMVCWGAPGVSVPDPSSWQADNPANYVSCVAYGGYVGTMHPVPAQGDTTDATPGSGTFSLTRDTSSGQLGLACPTPTNNANAAGGFGPCSPPASTTSTSLPTTTSIPGATTTSTSTTSSTLPAGLPPAVSGGRPRKTDCFAEWRVVGATGTRPVINCTDGDASCDKGDAQGCFFQAVLCFNDTANAIYNGKCSVASIGSFALTSPVRNTLDASNASAVLGAVAALGGTLSGDTVTFATPITTLRCTNPFNLTVLSKVVGGKPRKGVRVLRTRATAGKVDRDALRLVCIP